MSGTGERDRIERQARNVSPPLRRPVDRVRVACLAAVAARTLPLQSWTASFVLPCPFLPSFLSRPPASETNKKRGLLFFLREREGERERAVKVTGRNQVSLVAGGRRVEDRIQHCGNKRRKSSAACTCGIRTSGGRRWDGVLRCTESGPVSGRNCYCRTKGRMNERRSR